MYTDTIQYDIFDGTTWSEAELVTIKLTSRNDAPSAAAANYTMNEVEERHEY